MHKHMNAYEMHMKCTKNALKRVQIYAELKNKITL